MATAASGSPAPSVRTERSLPVSAEIGSASSTGRTDSGEIESGKTTPPQPSSTR